MFGTLDLTHQDIAPQHLLTLMTELA